MRVLPLALLALLVPATAATAAPSFKAFRTKTGNIRCAGTGDLKTGKDLALRCDIQSHSWRAPKRSKPCVEGDYGSSFGLTKRGRARFLCVSDAIDPTKQVEYGTLWRFGPFKCRIRSTGVRCVNAASHGWFLSKASYQRF